MKSIIVLFGSTLVSPATARDIDVAYTTPGTTALGLATSAEKAAYREAAIAAASTWAASKGLAHLPIDAHAVGGGEFGLTLPAPCGQVTPFEMLAGDMTRERHAAADGAIDIVPTVEHVAIWTLPAVLRAGKGDPSITRAFFALAKESAIHGCTLSPFAGGDDDQGPLAWAEYTCGMTALRSALRHSTPKALRALPCGAFVEAMQERGLSPAGLEWAKKGSPNAVLCFSSTGVGTIHGTEIAYDRAIAQLIDGTETIPDAAEARAAERAAEERAKNREWDRIAGDVIAHPTSKH